jgi:hypothetical protein
MMVGTVFVFAAICVRVCVGFVAQGMPIIDVS